MMATTNSWKEKWKSINSKFDTCMSECVTAYRTDEKCKDSIEAVMADIRNLKDWLVNDASARVGRSEIHALLNSPDSFNIRACGDLETQHKHLRVDDPKRENTMLVLESNHAHPSGFPVVFSAPRYYKGQDVDHWEDAVELARRALREWQEFLTKRGCFSSLPHVQQANRCYFLKPCSPYPFLSNNVFDASKILFWL